MPPAAAVAVTAAFLATVCAASCTAAAAADGPAWPAGASPPPDRCGPGPGLRAAALPRVVDLDRCDVRGRLVRGTGGVAAAVPRDGSSVTARLLHRHGAAELRISVNARAGTATIVERRVRFRATPPTARPMAKGSAPLPACADTGRRLGPVRWPRGTRIRWHYHPGTVARSGMPSTLAAIAFSRGVSGAVRGRTDCVTGARAYSPAPNITERFAGRTSAPPNIRGPGDCRARDGVNSFGWADLATTDPDTLAVTCTWHVGSAIREADIAVQTRGKRWWTTRRPRGGAQPVPGCPAGRYEAVSVITHEMLHVLGLRHIEGARHQNLSMSPYVRTCDDRAATLGRGDHLGLLDLYGARPAAAR